MDNRETSLPKWAQALIQDLRKRVAAGTEPLIRELVVLRPQVEKFKAQRDAIMELLTCAARGEHQTAAQIIEVLGSYGLDQIKK